MRSIFPDRFLFPQRRRFRDNAAGATKGDVSVVRLLSFLFGGILLANLVLMASAAFRDPAVQTPLQPGAVQRGPAAAVAAGQSMAAAQTTDGRAVADVQDNPPEKLPEPVVVTIGKGCAAHAREKLMVGLTNYYLQRRLRPGADSDDVADTSSVTALLAGPGDPAATTPDTSCQG